MALSEAGSQHVADWLTGGLRLELFEPLIEEYFEEGQLQALPRHKD